MTIQTRFGIGDTVWFLSMWAPKVLTGVVVSRDVRARDSAKGLLALHVGYDIALDDQQWYRSQNELYASKEEAEAALQEAQRG